MEGTDWFEIERRARHLRAQEIRRLLAAAMGTAKRTGGWGWSFLARRYRRRQCGANDAAL